MAAFDFAVARLGDAAARLARDAPSIALGCAKMPKAPRVELMRAAISLPPEDYFMNIA